MAPAFSDVFVHEHGLVESNDVGAGTRVWAFAHVAEGARVGANCNIGEGCFIESGAVVGDHVTIKNGVFVWDGVTIEDFAFVGPGASFTNDRYPRSWIKPESWSSTRVGRGASIGANATILCGVGLGRFSIIGAGSVVTSDVKDHTLVVGSPARPTGWVCICARRIRPGDSECECGSSIKWDPEGGPHVTGTDPGNS